MRLQGVAVWEILCLRPERAALPARDLQGIVDDLGHVGRRPRVVGPGERVVIVIRLLWMFLIPNVVQLADRPEGEARRRRQPSGSPSAGLACASQSRWPPPSPSRCTSTPGQFPDRALIVFLAFCVILVTLVGQGPLGPLIARLGLQDDGVEGARSASHEARPRPGLPGIEDLGEPDWIRPTAWRTPDARLPAAASPSTATTGTRSEPRRGHGWRYAFTHAQQQLVRMRNRGISDEVRRKIEHQSRGADRELEMRGGVQARVIGTRAPWSRKAGRAGDHRRACRWCRACTGGTLIRLPSWPRRPASELVANRR